MTVRARPTLARPSLAECRAALRLPHASPHPPGFPAPPFVPWAHWDGSHRGPGPWLALMVGVPQVMGCLVASRSQFTQPRMDAFAVALLITAALALVGRSRWPVAVLAIAAAATAAYFGMGYPRGPAFLALLVAVVNAVGRGRRRATWAVLAGAYAGFLVLERVVFPNPPLPPLAALRGCWSCSAWPS